MSKTTKKVEENKEELYARAREEWNKYGKDYDKITASFFERRLHVSWDQAYDIADKLSKEKDSDSKKVPYFVLKLRSLNQYAKQKTMIFAVWLIGSAVFLFFCFRYFWGAEQVGHFFEKYEDYETIQYVNLFDSKDEAKNYRLKAKIWRVSQGSESPRSTLLQEVYFPNGNTLFFEDSDCELELKTQVGCGDSQGDWWYIELTDQK